MNEDQEEQEEENELEVHLVITEKRSGQYFRVFIAAIIGSVLIAMAYAAGLIGLYAVLSGATATVFCIYVADQTGDLIQNLIDKGTDNDSGDNSSNGSDSNEVS